MQAVLAINSEALHDRCSSVARPLPNRCTTVKAPLQQQGVRVTRTRVLCVPAARTGEPPFGCEPYETFVDTQPPAGPGHIGRISGWSVLGCRLLERDPKQRGMPQFWGTPAVREFGQASVHEASAKLRRLASAVGCFQTWTHPWSKTGPSPSVQEFSSRCAILRSRPAGLRTGAGPFALPGQPSSCRFVRCCTRLACKPLLFAAGGEGARVLLQPLLKLLPRDIAANESLQ